MGNLAGIINNIIHNKNTLTIIIVFAGIIGLYMVYNWRVKDATTPIRVPYAKKELTARTQITDEMIDYAEVPKSLLNKADNIIRERSTVVNNFVNYNYTIPQYSFFYKGALLDKNKKPESEFSNIKDGYTVYNLTVDFDLTYGNSMYPGNYIDLFVEFNDKDTDKIVFGRLIKGIQIMSVVDSEGNNVFESSSTVRKPKYMFFAVPNDLFELLHKAENLGVKILPIPRNESYSSEERDAEIDSVYIQTYILSRSIY